MIKFLRKILGFIFVYIFVSVLLFFLIKTIEFNINTDIVEKNFIAIIGNSHPQTSINDSILTDLTPFKVKNYGKGGQSMFWSIIGGKKLKKQGVKCFVVELNNSSYTSGWKATDSQRGLKEVNKKFFLSLDDWKYLIKKDYVFTAKVFNTLRLPTTSLNGGFKKLEKDFTNKLVKENRNKNVNFKPDFNDELVHNFIKQNDSINFIVLRAPQHPKYYKTKSKKNEQFFLSRLARFRKYKNCKVMDFGHKYLADSLFADLGHMNHKGSTLFSFFLSDTLSKSIKINFQKIK